MHPTVRIEEDKNITDKEPQREPKMIRYFNLLRKLWTEKENRGLVQCSERPWMSRPHEHTQEEDHSAICTSSVASIQRRNTSNHEMLELNKRVESREGEGVPAESA